MKIVKVPGVNGLGKTAGARDAGNEVVSELRKKGKEFDIGEIGVDSSKLDEQLELIYQKL
jgi:hypothetical protein